MGMIEHLRKLTSACLLLAGSVQAASLPLDAKGYAGYAEFEKAAKHRAFTVAPGGGWSWRGDMESPELAEQAALADCQNQARQPCLTFALDDRIVFDRLAWSRAWRPYLTAAQAQQAPVGVKRGQRFPDLVYREAGGREGNLSGQQGHQRGQIVLLHFWGSWCPPCQREMPELQKLHARLKSDPGMRFVFLPVREAAASSRAWLRERRLSLPIADAGTLAEKEGIFLMSNGRNIRDRDMARAFPTTYILDRNGIVLFAHVGPVHNWLALEPMLKDALRAGD